MQPFTHRFPFVMAVLLMAPRVLFAQGQSELQASARADRTQIQLGQSVAVIVEVKGSDSKPEITIPASDDCYITYCGQPVSRTPSLAGRGGKGQSGGMPGSAQGLAVSLRSLTEKLAKDPLLDPTAFKGIGDPDLKKQLDAALGNFR